MKILVFSDSHGRAHQIDKALSIHKGKADLIIFLGDGLDDIDLIAQKYPDIMIYKVRGNCDFMCNDVAYQGILDIDGIRVMVCHGHKYNVKSDTDTLLYAGLENEVDAILFGHTHCALDTAMQINCRWLRLFNPGSIGMSYSYGVLETVNGVLVTSIASVL